MLKIDDFNYLFQNVYAMSGELRKTFVMKMKENVIAEKMWRAKNVINATRNIIHIHSVTNVSTYNHALDNTRKCSDNENILIFFHFHYSMPM